MTTLEKGLRDFKRISSSLLLILLTACAPKPQVIEFPLTQRNMAFSETTSASQLAVPKNKTIAHSAETIHAWEISGGIAAKSPKEAWTAPYHWSQQGPNQYHLRLMGPLGGKTIFIKQNNGQVIYQEGQKTITASSAESLLMKETGVRLPVSHFYYWLRGLPAPGTSYTFQTVTGSSASVLTQAGYTITYISRSSVKGIILPSKLELRGQGIKIKLVIQHWSF